MQLELNTREILSAQYIDFYDKEGAIRTGLVDDDSWRKNGVYVNLHGDRVFVRAEKVKRTYNPKKKAEAEMSAKINMDTRKNRKTS